MEGESLVGDDFMKPFETSSSSKETLPVSLKTGDGNSHPLFLTLDPSLES
jgi:hypothetical protein